MGKIKRKNYRYNQQHSNVDIDIQKLDFVVANIFYKLQNKYAINIIFYRHTTRKTTKTKLAFTLKFFRKSLLYIVQTIW